MKLGTMQPLKPYKFLQEQIFEGIWPFSKLRSPANVGLLTLLYFLWGFVIYVVYSIDIYFFIAGIFSALSISIWTLGIFRYANILRETEIEKLTSVNRKLLVQYLDALFHPSSIVIGIILYTITVVFFLWSFSSGKEGLLLSIQQNLSIHSLPPFILFYFLLVTFDICYRLGLSTYFMITQVRRNFWIHHYLDDSRLKPLFLPRNIKALENADKYHYIALLGGIFLFPMLIFDPILFLGLCFYLVIAFTIATINLFHLKVLRIKAIPQNVTALLSSSQFAYIGTNSPNQIPHITPTLFVYDGKHIFISTSIKSAKVNNLRRRKKIAVCIEYRKRNDISKSEGVLIQGQARIYGDNIILGLLFVMILGLKMFYIRTLFQKKYPDYLKYYNERKQFLPSAWRTLPLLSRTIIEIIPNRYIYWKGTKFSQIHA